jgi:hypothetical protein
VAAFCLLVFSGSAPAAHLHTQPQSCGHTFIAKEFRPWSAKVWSVQHWQRAHLKPATVSTYKLRLRCAAGPGHREAMRATWRRDRRHFEKHRAAELAARNIDHRWESAWFPSTQWEALPQLPPYVIAALAEKAGDYVGVDVPGWTMEQVTEGESDRKPGSAGHDVGGTDGYGAWAITDPFANEYLGRHGWTYADMWNPVRNAVVMAEMFADRGTAPWYGTSHVTDWSRHYRGRFDLRLVLGGETFREAVRGG